MAENLDHNVYYFIDNRINILHAGWRLLRFNYTPRRTLALDSGILITPPKGHHLDQSHHQRDSQPHGDFAHHL